MNDQLNSLNNLQEIEPPKVEEVKKEKPPRKNNSVIIIILLIVLCGLASYIFYDKFLKKAEVEVLPVEKELDVKSEEVTSLFNKFISGYLSTCNKDLEMYFTNKKMTSQDIKNRDAFSLAISIITKDNNESTIDPNKIHEVVASLFGSDYHFNDQTFDNSIVYTMDDDDKSIYKVNSLLTNGTCSNSNGDLYKIMRAVKIDDNIIRMQVTVIFMGSSKYVYYSDFNKNNILNTMADLTFDDNNRLKSDDFEKGDLYTIEFKLDNNNYIFSSAELTTSSIYTTKESEIVDRSVQTLLDDEIDKATITSSGNFVIKNLYVKDIENINDEDKLLTILLNLYYDGKFTLPSNPSVTLTSYLNTNNISSDKFIGGISLNTIKLNYDTIYSTTEETIDTKEKYNYLKSCPMFVYDSESKIFYAYQKCLADDIKNYGYNYKYTIFGDKILVYRAVGYQDMNRTIHTSYIDSSKTLSDTESLNFRAINALNYKDFDSYRFEFTLKNATQFKLLKITKE